MNKLKNIRMSKGKTIEDVAKAADVSIRAFQYYEKGEKIPNVYAAKRIAKALGCRVEDIF